MPQDRPTACDLLWDELEQVQRAIAAREETMRREINGHVNGLTILHHRADTLRRELHITVVTVDEDSGRHLQLVRDLRAG